MNLRRIECFLAVIEAGTVTAAAEHLHIAQPALSRQIKALERELRLPLFEPEGNRLVLTAFGRDFLPVAHRLTAETRAAERVIASIRDGRVTRLDVGATAASIRAFLAPFIARTGPGDPVLVTREERHYDLDASLRQGADLIISPTEPKSGTEVLSLGSIPLKAYVSPDHPWALAGRRSVTLDELCEKRVVLPSRSSVSRGLVDAALGHRGLALQNAIECDDGSTILALAVAGHAVGITTEVPSYGAYTLAMLTGEDGGTWADGPDSRLSLPLHVAWIPGHYASGQIRDVAEKLRHHVLSNGISIAEEDTEFHNARRL